MNPLVALYPATENVLYRVTGWVADMSTHNIGALAAYKPKYTFLLHNVTLHGMVSVGYRTSRFPAAELPSNVAFSPYTKLRRIVSFPTVTHSSTYSLSYFSTDSYESASYLRT